MKRIFVVVGLLFLMLGLRALETSATQPGASDPLTLAAIGFVILAAFAIAELLARAGLPKVTGYILSGVLLGPYAANVLSLAVVDEMRMFNTLALGLIALTAGLELELTSLRRLFATLGTTTLAKLVLSVPLVAGALIGIELTFHPLGLSDLNLVIGLGLVFGALALGTSPSISLAIIAESRAKGRLADLVLGAAVLKDLVVVVTLALCVAIAHALVGGEAIEASVVLHVAAELGLSLVVGAAIGGLLIAYIRWIKAEMLLFVAALVLVVAELSAAFHLELLLVCIAAGFVVRNFSDYEHDLLPPLQLVSLPVFVVFFTNAGAGVDLGATLALLPVALALVAVRALSYWLAAGLGNRFGGESEAVRANAWYAYLPQAGVTLGLVGIAVAQLPELGEQIQALGMPIVAINLLLGPVLLRTALRRAGELPDTTAAAESSAASADATDDSDAITLADAQLEARTRELRRTLGRELDLALVRFLQPWLQQRRRLLARLPVDAEPTLYADAAETHPPADALAFARTLATAFELAAARLEALELSRDVPLEPRWSEPRPDEAAWQRARRVLRRLAIRLGRRRAARRRVPLRLAARTAYEPRLATAMLELFRAACRCDAQLAELMRKRLVGGLAPEDLHPSVAALLDDFESSARALPTAALTSADRALRITLDRIDSPAMPIRALDFSEVASAIERELATLQQEAEAWPTVLDACWQSIAVTARVQVLHAQLAGGRSTVGELERACEAIDEELGVYQRRLAELREQLTPRSDDGSSPAPPSPEQLDALLTSLGMRCRGLLPKPAAKRLRQLDQRLGRVAELRAIRQAVRELFAREAGPRPLAATELVATASVPARLRIREVDVRELIDGEISGRLLPRTQTRIEAAAALIDETVRAATTLVSDIELMLEVYRAREPGETELDTLRTSLDRILGRASELHDRAITELRTTAQTIQDDFDAVAKHVATALSDATETNEAAQWVSRRADRARLRIVTRLAELRDRITATATRLIQRVSSAAASLSQDYRLRSGRSLLSANEIAELLPGSPSHLPREYIALFTDQPIRDPRFFVANREALRVVTRAERRWIDHEAGNAMLVIGGPGTGKTSLLSVAQLKLATREILWLPNHRRGLLDALAGELRCPARTELVLRRLHDRPRVIVIDDLQRLLPLGAPAVAEVQRLLELIAATASSCFWLVAVERELQRLLDPLLALRVGFSGVLELGSHDLSELETTISARHRISGLALAYPPAPRLRGLLTRIPGLRTRSQERQFFAQLARSGRGNLRATLAEWCRRAELRDQTLALAPIHRPRGLVFVRQLPPTALNLLALLIRFGPCHTSELAAELTLEPDELNRWLHFLATAGLIERDEQGSTCCPARIRDLLVPELIELALFHP